MNHAKICLVKQVARTAFLAGLLVAVSAGRTVESGAVEERDSQEDESHSRKPAECYTRLYESIMVRGGPDGRRYGLDELDPMLWNGSTFLLKGASHERFVTSLHGFASRARHVPHLERTELRAR